MKFGLIGHPISHSQSPALFKEAYGGRWAYDLIETPDFEEAWKRFIDGYQAVNVTMPFKGYAARRAGLLSDDVRTTGAANILVKTGEGIYAHNSDVLAVRSILKRFPAGCSIAVIGCGGAGKAALCAAEGRFNDIKAYHHDDIASGVTADIIIYTLPCAVPGYDRLECSHIIEANYKNPCLEYVKDAGTEYIPGQEWLLAQAREGYALMTGETPFLY